MFSWIQTSFNSNQRTPIFKIQKVDSLTCSRQLLRNSKKEAKYNMISSSFIPIQYWCMIPGCCSITWQLLSTLSDFFMVYLEWNFYEIDRIKLIILKRSLIFYPNFLPGTRIDQGKYYSIHTEKSLHMIYLLICNSESLLIYNAHNSFLQNLCGGKGMILWCWILEKKCYNLV